MAISAVAAIPQHIFLSNFLLSQFKLSATFIHGGGSSTQRKAVQPFFPIHHPFKAIAEAFPSQLLCRNFQFPPL